MNLAFLGAFLKNFQLTNSIWAGGGVAVVIYTLGAVLVSAGVVVPGIGPMTMTMVGPISILFGNLASALIPDTANQSVAALAKKLQTDIENIKAVIPQTYSQPVDFPNHPPQNPSPNNLHSGGG